MVTADDIFQSSSLDGTKGSFLVFPTPEPEVAAVLEFFGCVAITVSGGSMSEVAVEAAAPQDGFVGAIVDSSRQPEAAWLLCQHLRQRDDPIEPLLVLVAPAQLPELESRSDLFDDFLVLPVKGPELEARINRLLSQDGKGAHSDLISYESLLLNVETYQATIEGRPLDLTFMEYELLRFLAAEPGKVFSRETLLNRVWGYDYYGGARTVDVHVRRLRAKLGEEHSWLIQTVRSVGYKLGQSRWNHS